MIISKSLLLEMLDDLKSYYDGDCLIESDCARSTKEQRDAMLSLRVAKIIKVEEDGE